MCQGPIDKGQVLDRLRETRASPTTVGASGVTQSYRVVHAFRAGPAAPAGRDGGPLRATVGVRVETDPLGPGRPDRRAGVAGLLSSHMSWQEGVLSPGYIHTAKGDVEEEAVIADRRPRGHHDSQLHGRTHEALGRLREPRKPTVAGSWRCEVLSNANTSVKYAYPFILKSDARW
jgi:hypothetical protein